MDLTIFCDLESPFDRQKAKKEKKENPRQLRKDAETF